MTNDPVPSMLTSRPPEGQATAWAYCHVPNGSTLDMTGAIERQIERFAPGFGDLILERYKDRAQLASIWVDKFGEEPNGDVGRLVQQLLKSVAFRTVAEIEEADEGVEGRELAFLAKALKDMEMAAKISVEREIKIHEQVKKTVAAAAEKEVKSMGLSAERAAELREKLLGVKTRKDGDA